MDTKTKESKSIDLTIPREAYQPVQDGLNKILKFLNEKTKYAKSKGLSDDVYKSTINRIEGMIRYVEEEFSENPHWLYLKSVSSEILSYFKTAMLIEIHRLTEEKRNSGSKEINRAIDKKIQDISGDLKGDIFKDIELLEFYNDIVGVNKESSEMLEEKYSILDEEFKSDGLFKDNQKIKCFVILPIGKEDTIERENNMAVYDKIIKPCVNGSGYNIDCYHADLIEKSGDISKQVVQALRDDDIVIADLRRGNPNVIYELGIRHAFGKRSILICSEQREHLFHTTKYRAVRYRIDGKSNQEFFSRLSKQIDEVVKNPTKPDNPVTDILKDQTIDFVKDNTTITFDKFYLSRKFKGRFSLGQLYNAGNEDIFDLDITMYFIDPPNGETCKKGRVINSFDEPLKATPYSPTLLRKGETIDIIDFPQNAVNVVIVGRIGALKKGYKQEFQLRPHEK